MSGISNFAVRKLKPKADLVPGQSGWFTTRALVWICFLILALKLACQVNTWPQGCNIILGNFCYEVYIKRLYYSDAEEACQFRGGRLARMTSQFVSQNLSLYMKKALGCETNDYNIHRFWIGLDDREEEGTFVWSNHEVLNPYNYTAWAEGEPDNKESTTFVNCDCVSMSAFSEKWFDESCLAYARGYTCEYESKHCNIKDLFIANAEFDSCEVNATVPYQTMITMTCHPGYVITGKSNVTCQADGTWSNIPICQPGCPPPPFVNNSLMINGNPPHIIGTEITYVCDEGFFTDDYPSRTHFKITCSPHSKWVSDHFGCFPFSPYDAQNVELVPGQSIILPCIVDKNKIKASNVSNDKLMNSKTWMWLKDSENVESIFPEFYIQPNGSLLVTKFNEEAQGVYVCFLGNSFILPGKVSYELKLKSPSCDAIESETRQLVVEEGRSILLPCPHKGSSISMKWFWNEMHVHDSSEFSLFPDGSLYTSNATFMFQGIYTCMVVEKHTMCGRNHTTEVIVLTSEKSICGNVDKADDHPWTVSLWWEDEIAPFCYGTLIHDSWVLTSAQCLTGFYRRKKLTSFVSFDNTVKLGQLPKLNENKSIAQIAAIVIHPAFDKKMYANDIGLVELENPIQFSKNVQPLCLPNNDVTFISHCGKTMEVKGYVSGWGSIETARSDSRTLRDESMRLLNEDMCNGTDASYWENIICTVHDDISAQQTYAGDSGSPLEVEWKGRIYVVGIYSWGNRLKRKSGYDYFTRISTYRSWINSHVDAE